MVKAKRTKATTPNMGRKVLEFKAREHEDGNTKIISPKIDLHVHTSLSDGLKSPEEVIKLAAQKGIGVLAITDHNIMHPELVPLGEKYGVRVLIGSEVSTIITLQSGKRQEIHIIALDYDPDNSKMKDMLQKNFCNREEYLRGILKKLESKKFYISYEELKDEFPDTLFLARSHIAYMMKKKGYISDTEEAFDKYIGNYQVTPCYINPAEVNHYADLEQAVKAILDAGGRPVLCHPFYYPVSREEMEEVYQTFSRACGRHRGAMEVYYGSYSRQQIQELLEVCREYSFLPSAGSDYHGRDHQTLNGYPYEIWEGLSKGSAYGLNKPGSKKSPSFWI
ncbi:MAG: PHP domain-containing protein [Clostridia bacterium]|nr:PHP domain-containing protein [Clostridia bacterium]NCC43510.1 PHP domain-containing protein [Clostridia bacterium]